MDVSSITVTSNSGTTHTTTYQHPLDLIVHNTISAQIEPDTALTFTAATSINEDNFTVQYITDDHNDGAVQLGLEGVSYTLRDHAIAITFERVSSSPSVYLRDNANVAYTEIKLYTNSTVTDSADALSIITNSSFAHFSEGAMYTHDKTARTVTLWTSHLSTAKENSTSSGGGDESDSNSPTLGKTSSGAQLVTNGFEYNGLTVNVDRYHTEFPLIGTNVGDINTISMKIYDSAGPSGIKRVEFALGVPDIGLYHEAEAFVEVWMQRDSVAVQETIIVDELNLLEDSDVSATVSQTSCSGGEQQCLLVELQYSYREPPACTIDKTSRLRITMITVRACFIMCIQYSKPFVTSWALRVVLPSNRVAALSSPPPELVQFFCSREVYVHNVTVRAVLSCVYMAPSLK